MQDIDSLISDCINQINDKIIGVNFLEKLKYEIINKLKSLKASNFDDLAEKENNIQIGQLNFLIEVVKNTKKSSKIKKTNNFDNLLIVLEGGVSFTIHEEVANKPLNQLFLNQYTGIVLSKKTIVDEIVSKDTIFIKLNIIDEKQITETN